MAAGTQVPHLTPHTSVLSLQLSWHLLWPRATSLVDLVAVWRIVAEIWQTLGWFVGHLCPITPHTGLSITPDTAPPLTPTLTLTLIIKHSNTDIYGANRVCLLSCSHQSVSPIKYLLDTTSCTLYVNMLCVNAPVTKPPEHHSFILTNLLGKLYNWETGCESYKCSNVIIQSEEPVPYICVWLGTKHYAVCPPITQDLSQKSRLVLRFWVVGTVWLMFNHFYEY